MHMSLHYADTYICIISYLYTHVKITSKKCQFTRLEVSFMHQPDLNISIFFSQIFTVKKKWSLTVVQIEGPFKFFGIIMV